jgi:hypothetical protein
VEKPSSRADRDEQQIQYHRATKLQPNSASAAKAFVFRPSDVAAEAATHKDHL